MPRGGDGAMNEFDLVNRLAAPREVVESVSDDFVIAPISTETLAAVNRELAASAPQCSVCSARVLTIAQIRAAQAACPCREEGV
jgi:hypothetical protein